MSEIILSLAVTGRNDQYGHDFKRRFAQAMNLLAWSAEKNSVLNEIEVVFTDWNSKKAIAEDITVSENAKNILRFIEVPPEIAVNYNTAISPFHQSYAFNVALRRCRGKYLGIMPADILFSSHAIRNLMQTLKELVEVDFDLQNSVIAIPRKNLPFFARESFYFENPEKAESLLLAGDSYMHCDNHSRGLMGGYGAFIFSRALLYDLRGVDERIAGWGYNDIDIALRCADRAKVINTSGYGITCYDFEPSNLMVAQKEEKREKIKEIIPGSAENTEDWGLAKYEFKESKAANKIKAESYTDTSPIPSELEFRDWILWLSQRISAFEVTKFSAKALAAGWIANKKQSKNILLFGFSDRAIVSLLSLTVPLANLTIVEGFLDDKTFYKNWYNDAFLGSLRFQGRVHYLPGNYIPDNEKYDLIIVDDLLPENDTFLKFLTNEANLLVSQKDLIKLFKNEEILDEFELEKNLSNNIALICNEMFSQKELDKQWKAMNGNVFSSFIMLFKKYFSKMEKLRNILMRQPLLKWPKTIKIIYKIWK